VISVGAGNRFSIYMSRRREDSHVSTSNLYVNQRSSVKLLVVHLDCTACLFSESSDDRSAHIVPPGGLSRHVDCTGLKRADIVGPSAADTTRIAPSICAHP